MNKPAPKEPSMDEILSSIRQIIADDDVTVPRRAAPPPVEAAVPELAELEPTAEDGDDEIGPGPLAEPLALSPEQIVPPQAAEMALAGFDMSGLDGPMLTASEELATNADPMALLVDPEDIAFEPEPMREPEPELAPVAVFAPPPPPAIAAPPPAYRASTVRQTAAQAAPMPDPSLSDDIAEQLIEPTTNAAVRANFARLGAIGTPGMTIEGMMRDMLKPMLKEWLDENLPAVVERMVEKEIARISRGVE
jgi:cell pole-organizing protein PopZ